MSLSPSGCEVDLAHGRSRTMPCQDNQKASLQCCITDVPSQVINATRFAGVKSTLASMRGEAVTDGQGIGTSL